MTVENILAPVLKGVSPRVAVDAIYYLTRLIRHRNRLKGTRPLVEGLRNEPSPEAVELAEKLWNDLGNVNQVSLEGLSDAAIGQIVSQLEQFLKDKYMEGAEINTDRGATLLRAFRSVKEAIDELSPDDRRVIDRMLRGELSQADEHLLGEALDRVGELYTGDR